MSIKRYYKLNIDVSTALKVDWQRHCKVNNLNSDSIMWNHRLDLILNRSWINYMNSIELPVSGCLIFYKHNCILPYAHIDIFSENPLKICSFGINWCIGGSKSEMVWYKPDESVSFEVKKTPANTPHVSCSTSRLVEIDRCHIGNFPVVVNTDIFHNVETYDEPRWGFSLRINNLLEKPWNEVIHILKSKGLLLEQE
jgi:hypothetical protein